MSIELPARHFVNQDGKYLGKFIGRQYPGGEDPQGRPLPPIIQASRPADPSAIEVTTAPNHGRDTWDGAQWLPYTKPPVDLDAALANVKDPVLAAILDLLPGGKAAVRTKMAEQRAAKRN